MSELTARLARVQERIEGALARSKRPAGSVTLVAVTKTFPAATVVEAAGSGLTHFGENRVQEAAAKIRAVSELLNRPHLTSGTEHPDPAVHFGPKKGVLHLSWHLVGHLQSNKAKQAVGLFDLVHSLDTAVLAQRLDEAAAAAGKRQAVLVQVNVAGEATKSGVAPDGLRALIDAVRTCPSLVLRGLMTVPPYDPDPERSRQHFAALRDLGESVGRWLAPDPYPGELSMGMSEDFEVAIEEGATLVRVGRALFGDRVAP